MTMQTPLTLKDTYQLLSTLPLGHKSDSELEELVEQILQLRSGDELRQLLQHHRSD